MFKKAMLLMTAFSLTMNAFAGDAQIKAQLLGYWKSPRHPYLIQADGLMRMCPTTGPYAATVVNRWDVRNGVFYMNIPNAGMKTYKIVTLNKRQFVIQGISGSETGDVFNFYRTTRADAESQ